MDEPTKLKTKLEYEEEIEELKRLLAASTVEWEDSLQMVVCPCCCVIEDGRLVPGPGCEGCEADGWIDAATVRMMFGELSPLARYELDFADADRHGYAVVGPVFDEPVRCECGELATPMTDPDGEELGTHLCPKCDQVVMAIREPKGG